MSETPPNETLCTLESILGDASTREIVRLFLEEFPASISQLVAGSREDRMRIVHGLKSSALHMGATLLSERMSAIEARLAGPGAELAPAEIDGARAAFDEIAPSLRRYASA